jgi:hypothetical protein
MTSAEIRIGPRSNDIAHKRFPDRAFVAGRELRIFRKPRDRPIERAAQIEEQARAGRAVVPPPTKRLEQCIAR